MLMLNYRAKECCLVEFTEIKKSIFSSLKEQKRNFNPGTYSPNETFYTLFILLKLFKNIR